MTQRISLLFISILKMGLSHASNTLDRRRVILFNYLLVLSVIACLVLLSLTSFFGLWRQTILCFVGLTFFVSIILINNSGHKNIAKASFIGFSIVALFVGTYFNLQNGLFVESENMLFAVMAAIMFLIDGRRKHVAYWLAFLVMISLKMITYDFRDLPHDSHFLLALVNNSFVGCILYVFLLVFRNILVGALYKTEQHEKTLTTLMDNVPIFMALVDENGKYLLANQNYSERFGLTKKEIVGKRREEVLPSNIQDENREMMNRALVGESVSFVGDTALKDGSKISVNGQFVPIKNGDGDVEFIAICVDDITDLVKAQKEMKRANETKDKLFSIIAHDIRSPLNLFQSILNISHDDIITKEEFLVYQDDVKNKLHSLTVTVDELLDWARMQLGGINAYPKVVDVNEVINENVDLFKYLVDQKEIEFSIETQDGLKAFIDENHFRVVLRNLIHNALKYTWKGGKVRIETAKSEDEIYLSISDSGIGMSAEKIESIINKNLQKSEAGTDKESGTGLGLSLSIGLLERNNCQIYVLSEVDKGTTVEIRIPTKPTEDSTTK
ncbi:MAG: PAS domain S-box protein [Ekhidna sp.]